MEEQTTDLEVTVKTLDSQSRTYTVGAQLTIKDFKEHIALSVGIPVDKQRLIYQGRVLQDERTLADYNVGGKVIHLVERAPPPPSQPGSGSGGGAADSSSSSSTQGSSQMPPHDRNANTYVILDNIMDPQQMQNQRPRVYTFQSTGSVDVHIDMDPSMQSDPRLRFVPAEMIQRDISNVVPGMEGTGSASVHIDVAQRVQSEPWLRLVLAENMLRDINNAVSRMENRTTDGSSQTDASTAAPHPSTSSTTSTPSPSAQPMDTSPPPSTPPPPPTSSSSPPEGPTPQPGPIHPSPAELADMLTELRRVEERLQPFIQRAHTILETAATSEYNNNTERDDDQRTLVQTWECLRLLGNALVALSDLRLNLMSPVPRHLHVVRLFSHYTNPATMPGAVRHHIPVQIFPSSTLSFLGSGAADGQAQPTQPNGQQEQTGSGPNLGAAGQQMPGQAGGAPHDFFRNIVQQINQYASSMVVNGATGAPAPPSQPAAAPPPQTSSGATGPKTQTTTPTAPPPPPPPPPSQAGVQARVFFTRPPFAPNMPPPTFGAQVPGMAPQQPGQPFNPAALNQMISGLVGQLLLNGQMGPTVTTPLSTSSSSTSSSFSFSTSAPPQQPPPATNTQDNVPPAQDVHPDQAGGGAVPGVTPLIAFATLGVSRPVFVQGVSDFMQQASQPVFSGPPPPNGTNPAPGTGPNPTPNPAGAAEALNPELFTGIVRGVLSSMMGSLGQTQNDTESIAQFMQRLSQATNLFISPEDPTGFFGELLMLVCQTFTMTDLVMLLHGQHQPLTRIQPQLSQFFTQNYLNGREPTDQNITAAAETLVNELEEYITESFRESSVSVLDGVDITQTNMSFFRQQLTLIATHILRCSDETFGPRLLQMCNQALFECLALNLHCVRGDQRALTSVINHRIQRMSSDISPSLVNWMTSMMTMRLQFILEHIPVTQEQIQSYIVPAQRDQSSDREPEQTSTIADSHSPAAATTAEEAMSVSHDTRQPLPRETRAFPADLGAAAPLGGDRASGGAEGMTDATGESESWAAAVPPEWVPIIRCDMITQRKMKAQPPLSDAYLHGMPAKRRKTGQGAGSLLSLSDAVSQAARTAGVKPMTSGERLQDELETEELKEAYAEQVKSDIKKRVRDDTDFNSKKFPNADRAFSSDS